MHLKSLHDQVVVITGASSGIGLATAHAAVAKGARVVLNARNGDALETIAGGLRRTGGQVAVVAADIADETAADAIADAALSAVGRVDTWVNNAAAAIYGKVAETSEADHRRVFDVGYFGLVRGSLRAVALLRDHGGALVNVGSILGERTMILQGSYSAMKHAVAGFTDALRMEIEAEALPISVTLIKPAGMHTPYPEHARNLMDRPARIPPFEYDPRLVATAILFAAQHRRREMTVGGYGLAIAKFGQLFPRLTDLGMELLGAPLQQIDEAPPPAVNDNLHEPREDGRIDAGHDVYVRTHSLWLAAQMNPVAAIAAAGAGVALGIAAGRRRA